MPLFFFSIIKNGISDVFVCETLRVISFDHFESGFVFFKELIERLSLSIRDFFCRYELELFVLALLAFAFLIDVLAQSGLSL